VFKTIEDQLGPSDMRGAGGPVGVSIPETDEEVTNAIVTSAQKVGWQRVADTNAHDDERIGFTPSSIKNGIRVSAASAFLRPARRRPNLTYLKRTKAGYLLFDGKRIVGVRARDRGGWHDYLSAKEVIVSAGTVESTLLLERSGDQRPSRQRGSTSWWRARISANASSSIEPSACRSSSRETSAGPRSSIRCRRRAGRDSSIS
jgi:choline dehydrogenase-like flavoprotein